MSGMRLTMYVIYNQKLVAKIVVLDKHLKSDIKCDEP